MPRAPPGYGQSMNALLSIVLSVAAASGVFIILGIVAGVVVLGFLGHLLVDRFGRTKRESLDRESQPPGRVGRGGKRRGQ